MNTGSNNSSDKKNMSAGRRTAIFYITNNGRELAQRLEALLPDTIIQKFSAGAVVESWPCANSVGDTNSNNDKNNIHNENKKNNKNCVNDIQCMVFIMATGIVVRTIAPLLSDKRYDPAVVVLDEKGDYAISLAGGHIGGANELTREIAKFLDAEPVITTASDVNNLPAIDLWASENNLVIENWEALHEVGVRFINNGKLNVFIDTEINTEIKTNLSHEINLPPEFICVDNILEADIVITAKDSFDTIDQVNPIEKQRYLLQVESQLGNQLEQESMRSRQPKQPMHPKQNLEPQLARQLLLRPKTIIAGIGCNKGTAESEIEEVVASAFKKCNLSLLALDAIATIDLKAEEPGLLDFARKHNVDVKVYSVDELNAVDGVEKSETVFKATGAYAVAEPSAILAAQANDGSPSSLLMRKQRQGNVTVALAAVNPHFASNLEAQPTQTGTIYIVGTGPGSIEHITPYAQKAVHDSDIIVGYHTYLRLIPELIDGKKLVATGMTKELDRCEKAVDLALEGKTVSVISGGDPGIYAMAGLVFEVLKARAGGDKVEIEIIPGISALNACASRLGAPIMHDFASISLSDRLTPWPLIEKRLAAAASADFVIILYNPRSRGRQNHINRAVEIMLEHRSPTTPVGIVKGAMRPGETVIHTDLVHMLDHEIDMQTTVIIGNPATFKWNGRMITPRGYKV